MWGLEISGTKVVNIVAEIMIATGNVFDAFTTAAVGVKHYFRSLPCLTLLSQVTQSGNNHPCNQTLLLYCALHCYP